MEGAGQATAVRVWERAATERLSVTPNTTELITKRVLPMPSYQPCVSLNLADRYVREVNGTCGSKCLGSARAD